MMNSGADRALTLVEPDGRWKAEVLEMARECSAHGEPRYEPALADFDAYLRELASYARGVGLPDGHVPQTTYWGLVGGEIVGSIRLRHRLTPDLEVEGGHIGYDVRPSRRGRGYATQMLALVLDRAREMDLARVLITCDADNIASARVIQKNGGRPAGQTRSPESGLDVLRFWIELER